MTLRDNEIAEVGVAVALAAAPGPPPAPAPAVAPAAAHCAQRKTLFVVDKTIKSEENKERNMLKNDSNERAEK